MDLSASAPVLLFDGECPLCQRVVRFLLWLDGNERLRFAPLQGAAGQAFLRARGLPMNDFDSLIFVPNWPQWQRGEYLQRTDGVLAALRLCGGWGEEAAALVAIWPRNWRDAGYRGIARARHRLFSPPQKPLLSRPEWAERFLP